MKVNLENIIGFISIGSVMVAIAISDPIAGLISTLIGVPAILKIAKVGD